MNDDVRGEDVGRIAVLFGHVVQLAELERWRHLSSLQLMVAMYALAASLYRCSCR